MLDLLRNYILTGWGIGGEWGVGVGGRLLGRRVNYLLIVTHYNAV